MAINRLKETAAQNSARVNAFHRPYSHRPPNAGISGGLPRVTGELKTSYQNHSVTLDEIKMPAGAPSAPFQPAENNLDSNILELAPAENLFVADDDILEF